MMNNNIVTVQQPNEIIESKGVTEDLYTRFIAYLDASPKTVQTYQRNLRQFFKYLYSNGIRQPRREDILAYRNELLEDKKPATVQNYITVVRIFFTWTEQEGLYPNIAEHIKGAKISKNHKKDNLTIGQVKSILEDIDKEDIQGKRDYAILALLFTTALRTIEISRAKIEDLGTVGTTPVLYIQGKGRNERTEYVKLQEPVEQAIREYLKTRPEAEASEALFTSLSNNSKGKNLSTRSISGIVKNSFKDAGYNSDRLTAHSTRHTAITIALQQGNTVQEVQQFARHSNINTTMIYAHNLERANNKCEESVANAIF